MSVPEVKILTKKKISTKTKNVDGKKAKNDANKIRNLNCDPRLCNQVFVLTILYGLLAFGFLGHSGFCLWFSLQKIDWTKDIFNTGLKCSERQWNDNGKCVPCRETCLKNSCDAETGACKNGCKEMFMGKFCTEHPKCKDKCIKGTCKEDLTCIEGCAPDYFGNKCERKCAENCAPSAEPGGRKCNLSTGICYKCQPKTTGTDRGCSLKCHVPNCAQCCDTSSPERHCQKTTSEITCAKCQENFQYFPFRSQDIAKQSQMRYKINPESKENLRGACMNTKSPTDKVLVDVGSRTGFPKECSVTSSAEGHSKSHSGITGPQSCSFRTEVYAPCHAGGYARLPIVEIGHRFTCPYRGYRLAWVHTSSTLIDLCYVEGERSNNKFKVLKSKEETISIIQGSSFKLDLSLVEPNDVDLFCGSPKA